MTVNINRQLAGLEDLLFGVGTVEQDRGGNQVTVTMINAANMPFDESRNLQQVMDTDYAAVAIVATNIDDVTNVSDNMTMLTNISDNIVVVGDNIDDINTVADNILSVTSVSTNINSVNTTSTNINSVNTTSTNINSINTVASISGDVTTVAGISEDVTTVANSNITVISDDLSNHFKYSNDLGSITEPVEGETGDSKIRIVADNIDDVVLVGSNIDDINTAADNIVAIQGAAQNATDAADSAQIATTKASEASTSASNASTSEGNASTSASNASTSEGNASTSADNAQLAAWVSEAERRTSDSYATEPEDVFVKLWTSDGDGTFTATDTTEYSALHWRNKAEEIVAGSGVLLQVNNLDDLDNLETAKVNLELDQVDNTSDINKPTSDATQAVLDSLSEAIANLATAQASIKEDGSITVTATQQVIGINSVVPSTDTNIFEISDANDTMTFKTNASINFFTAMTFTSSTPSARTVSVKVINVADDTILKSFDIELSLPTGDTETVAPTFLLTVGKNTIPSADLTVRFEIVADDTGYALDAFKVVIASSSSYDVSTLASGISYDNTTSGIAATNAQDAIDEALNLDLGGIT